MRIRRAVAVPTSLVVGHVGDGDQVARRVVRVGQVRPVGGGHDGQPTGVVPLEADARSVVGHDAAVADDQPRPARRGQPFGAVGGIDAIHPAVGGHQRVVAAVESSAFGVVGQARAPFEEAAVNQFQHGCGAGELVGNSRVGRPDGAVPYRPGVLVTGRRESEARSRTVGQVHVHPRAWGECGVDALALGAGGRHVGRHARLQPRHVPPLPEQPGGLGVQAGVIPHDGEGGPAEGDRRVGGRRDHRAALGGGVDLDTARDPRGPPGDVDGRQTQHVGAVLHRSGVKSTQYGVVGRHG